MNTNKSIREYRAMDFETLASLAATTRATIAKADAQLDYQAGDAATRELAKIEKALGELF
ncbi:hypothetical protein QDW36_gp45 [Microbacterium phage Avocadoman]|uniref:hypothetical protein n=1 Tax=Microbacterium phage Avocadoman TaxID=2776864 RepID=UPI0018A44539|nr:hypothetical protein QDW36_gp45 [Microbacterium phage Avocadoman]QOP64897.1 hypothetical protein SEA_AVOCADOMAN_45 [Microbacterium phage Avocadoman]